MASRRQIWLVPAFAAFAGIRRVARRSGVTDEEFFGPLPGDDVMTHPMLEWTRATTIDVPPEQVWPWLVQMGYGRGGWYTNERFDRIVWHIENPSADVILPEWQHLAVGDVVPDGPDFAAYFRVKEIRENETIVYHSIRHPYRGQPVDPTDQEALRAGRRNSWPVGSSSTSAGRLCSTRLGRLRPAFLSERVQMCPRPGCAARK